MFVHIEKLFTDSFSGKQVLKILQDIQDHYHHLSLQVLHARICNGSKVNTCTAFIINIHTASTELSQNYNGPSLINL